MKQIKLSILGICLVFMLVSNCTDESPTSSGAGSGACSSHDGVNCGAGPDSDGSVICNDGWRNSSLAYSQVCGGLPGY